MAGLATARAQDIEPRTYSNAPVGVNFLIAGDVYTSDGLAYDPSLPLKNPQLKTSSAVLAYARVIDLWSKSGKIDAIVPYTWLSGTADLAGQAIKREVGGLADSKFRLSANLCGASALTLKEFADSSRPRYRPAANVWGRIASINIVNSADGDIGDVQRGVTSYVYFRYILTNQNHKIFDTARTNSIAETAKRTRTCLFIYFLTS
jgi:hypothetical protein